MIRTYAYKDIKIGEIFAREEEKTNVADMVAQIIAEVRKGGDAALKRYAEQFDGAAPAMFEVSEEERAAAYAQADAAFLEILKEAAAHIRAFHEKQKRTDFVLTEREGVVLGQKIIPLDRVGLYVPGGTASYPSTVLMDCIPAKIAGVKEVCMETPISLRRRKSQGLTVFSESAAHRRLRRLRMARKASLVWIKS